MSIRLRIIMAIFLVALVPIVILSLLARMAFLQQSGQIALQTTRTALEIAAEKNIQQRAEAVAAQIEIYLQTHPNLNPLDIAALQADKTLANIAIQPVGETGYTAVHDSRGINIFHRNPKAVNTPLSDLQSKLPAFWALVEASLDGTPVNGYYDWIEPDNSIRKKYMAIVPVPNTPLRVAATTYIDEFHEPIIETTGQLQAQMNDVLSRLGLLALISGIFAIMAAMLLGWQITTPLEKLRYAAEAVAQGNWETIVPQKTNDEVGALSQSIYEMSHQLRNAIENLDELRTRTKDLSRRIAQLEAITFIAREVARVKHPDTLMRNAVELIRDRFGFYHVGIFLVDETGEYAHLVAATGEIGQTLIENKHQLKVGETSIVGTVTATGYPRIIQNVGKDQVYFKNPLLPDTRSEMTIPLRAGNQIIGALDIQSTQESAFDEEDIGIMSTLADQLASAIENARLVERLENANKEMRALYEIQKGQNPQLWTENEVLAYEYDRFHIRPIDNQIPDTVREQLLSGQTVALDASQAKQIKGVSRALLLVPLMLRGQALGAIGLESSDPDHQWTSEEITTVESIATQAAVSLENARLLEEAQQRAFQEKAVNDITARVSSSMRIESVLRTTAQELSRLLQDAEVLIQLNKREG
ncbi:MAG: GAF domain-containing protein [Candidatus Villigracilaceae bacterium]